MSNSNNPDNKFFTDPEGRKISIADDDLMIKFYEMDLYSIFCREVLEFDPEAIMVTDESTVSDFPESDEHYIAKIKEVFKLDVSDLKVLYLHEILQRIIDQRQPLY